MQESHAESSSAALHAMGFGAEASPVAMELAEHATRCSQPHTGSRNSPSAPSMLTSRMVAIHGVWCIVSPHLLCYREGTGPWLRRN
jgi:arylsulfatase A-like enzyme